MKKILITGGHVTPALAVIEKLKNVEIIYVGRRLSLEYDEIVKKNIRFIELKAGRLTRAFSFESLINFLLIPMGFISAKRILNKEKPDVILSFGGYLAMPICYWGYKFGIPTYTHEQTIAPGAANRRIAKFAKKVFVSFEETQKYFPENKVIYTGDPLRSEIFKVAEKPFEVKKERKVIYISGGSLGSLSVNRHIKNILDKLLEKYIVIHQTGEYEEVLPKKNYFPKKHFTSKESGYIYSVCDLVIGRSGANTFFELIAVEKPAIFIPLPWSANHEQQKQAGIFKASGTGEIFNQDERSEKLLELVYKVAENLTEYKENFKKLKSLNKKDAATIIVKEISS